VSQFVLHLNIELDRPTADRLEVVYLEHAKGGLDLIIGIGDVLKVGLETNSTMEEVMRAVVDVMQERLIPDSTTPPTPEEATR
jgi:hypothetical protein